MSSRAREGSRALFPARETRVEGSRFSSLGYANPETALDAALRVGVDVQFFTDFLWIIVIFAAIGWAVGVALRSFSADDYDGPASCKPKRASRIALVIARLRRQHRN